MNEQSDRQTDTQLSTAIKTTTSMYFYHHYAFHIISRSSSARARRRRRRRRCRPLLYSLIARVLQIVEEERQSNLIKTQVPQQLESTLERNQLEVTAT